MYAVTRRHRLDRAGRAAQAADCDFDGSYHLYRARLLPCLLYTSIRLSVALICAPRFGIAFVWLAVPAGWLANFLVSYAALRKSWPTEKVVSSQ